MPEAYDPDDDYYQALGVKAPVTSHAAREAAAKAIAKLPAGDAGRARVERAAAVLGDAVRRAAYDKARQAYLRGGSGGAGGKITGYQGASAAGLAAAEEQVKNAPDDLDALEWLAFQYYSSNALDKAIGAYARFLQRRPEDASAHHYIARAYQRTGRVAEAIPHWQRVIALEPGTERALRAAEALREAGAPPAR